MKAVAVVLAGGSGTRLWPLSRLQIPKQFLAVVGDSTLFEATVNRLAPLIARNDVLVVSSRANAMGEGHGALAPFNKLLEPVGRNTAPAIALAAARLMAEGREDGDPIMVVLPADHVITNVPAFHDCLRTAIDCAAQDRLVTFGIRALHPETGFGYLNAPGECTGARKVARFKEKPDRATAERMLAEGGWFWNSGMFVWRASAILKAIAEHAPEVHAAIANIRTAAKSIGWQPAIEAHFADAPGISIDHAVLEKAADVWAVPADIGWSDVGSWDAVHDIAEKDECGNALQGQVIALDSQNTLVRGANRLIATIGVEDLTIVDTPDALLVAKRGHAQDVKHIVAQLQQRDTREHIEHLTVQRPWGRYTVLQESPGCKIKSIVVNPGGRLSLQSHQHRSEHWVVTAGTATVTRGEELYTVAQNESTFIPAGIKHRLENRGSVPLEIIEVQVGSYVGEDDITRYDDQYGRVTDPTSAGR